MTPASAAALVLISVHVSVHAGSTSLRAGLVRGAARTGRLAAGLAGFRAAARRPVTCTGAVAVVATELAASVKPAVPGGTLAGPRRSRRPR
jgi:hypothetical protein